MQCVQAIPDCMKKGKAEYHNVPPMEPSVVFPSQLTGTLSVLFCYNYDVDDDCYNWNMKIFRIHLL